MVKTGVLNSPSTSEATGDKLDGLCPLSHNKVVIQSMATRVATRDYTSRLCIFTEMRGFLFFINGKV
jgi:hypothetical protein